MSSRVQTFAVALGNCLNTRPAALGFKQFPRATANVCTRLDMIKPYNSWTRWIYPMGFATFLYYLNDVDEGGETAFPLAGVSLGQLEEKMQQETMRKTKWYNLSHHCHEAPLVVTPQRGKAILWYNHYLDPQTGYLGEIDGRTQHGGCDVVKGTKWIATNWIVAPTYKERFKGSRNFVKPQQ